MVKEGLDYKKIENLKIYYGRNEMIFETNSFVV